MKEGVPVTDKRKHALPLPEKKTADIADVIWGEIKGTYATQAISDTTHRQPKTGIAIPDDMCVEENKDWVDFNEK